MPYQPPIPPHYDLNVIATEIVLSALDGRPEEHQLAVLDEVLHFQVPVIVAKLLALRPSIRHALNALPPLPTLMGEAPTIADYVTELATHRPDLRSKITALMCDMATVLQERMPRLIAQRSSPLPCTLTESPCTAPARSPHYNSRGTRPRPRRSRPH